MVPYFISDTRGIDPIELDYNTNFDFDVREYLKLYAKETGNEEIA